MDLSIAKVALPLLLLLNACAGSAPLPPKAVALNNEAARNIARGNLDRAQAEAKVAIEYNPKFIEATFNLGLVEFERGNFVAARDQFVKARAINRDLPWGEFGLGLIADATSRLAEAEAHYRNALAIDPGFSEARINLATILTKEEKPEEAYAELKKCAETAPAIAEVWVMLIKTGIELRRFADLDEIVRGAALHVGKPEASVIRALRLLAIDRIDLGSIDETERILREAKVQAPFSWHAAIEGVLEALPQVRALVEDLGAQQHGRENLRQAHVEATRALESLQAMSTSLKAAKNADERSN